MNNYVMTTELEKKCKLKKSLVINFEIGPKYRKSYCKLTQSILAKADHILPLQYYK